jgi:gas vesicle protein
MEEECVPMEMVEPKRRMRSPKLSGILLGALIGVGAALLTAPYSGQETRNRIRTKSMELKDMASEKAQETRSRVSEIAHTGADRASEIKDRGQSVIEEQRINIESAIEGIRKGVRTYREPDTTETYTETSLNPYVQSTDLTDPTTGTGEMGPA